MTVVEINDNHRRALTAAIQSVQRVLTDFKHLIAKDSHAPRPLISAETAQELTNKLTVAREQLTAFCNHFNIVMESKRDPLWTIQVGVAHLWEILEDCKSKPMSRYGQVPAATQTILDDEIQRLIDVLESIAAIARQER